MKTLGWLVVGAVLAVMLLRSALPASGSLDEPIPLGVTNIPACESVVYWGKPVPPDLTKTGCTNTVGSYRKVPGVTCIDGSVLVTFTQHSSWYWGRTGQWWRGVGPDHVAQSRDYREALAACLP
jgi:hypothetical protein